jgi:uncharacterized protein (DUF2147 family)
MVRHFVLAIFVLTVTAAEAAGLTPVGLWQTIDESTGQPKGLVRIREHNGQHEGSVEKTFLKPGQNPSPKCIKCDGARHNQPVLGMTILWGFTKQENEYGGGEILDPEDGKIYHAKMKLIDGGQKLEVRGYIGTPMLGHTRIWLREE